jgi:hypothetical protein
MMSCGCDVFMSPIQPRTRCGSKAETVRDECGTMRFRLLLVLSR